MKTKTFTLLIALFTTITAWTQATNNYYYYKNQQTSITLSEKVMFVKFLPNLSNSQKQNLITQAKVDLMNADWNNIPNLIQAKSRILQRQVWVYPCGIIPLEARSKLTKKELELAIVQKPAPCEGCPPPDCTPYQIWQPYDNFYEALFFFLDNTNIRSASKAVIKNNVDTVATCEDFYIKIKSGYSICKFNR